MDHATKFGDNDRLSAVVAKIVKADLLIMLSDIDGLFDKNPAVHADAKLRSHVADITEEIICFCRRIRAVSLVRAACSVKLRVRR